MKEFLKRQLWFILSRRLGVEFFIKYLEDTVTVLMYHGIIKDSEKMHAWTLVKASEFEKQLNFLKTHFEIITPDDLIAVSKNQIRQEKKPKVIITFDDGLCNNFSVALPLLEKYSIPATIYISTEAVQKNELFWWDKIIETVFKDRIETINLSKYSLGVFKFNYYSSPAYFWGDIQKLLDVIKTLSPEIRQQVLREITQSNAFENSSLKPLTPAEVTVLAESDLITIGSHTHCHSILTQISSQKAKNSIQTSIRLLNEWTGKEINHFAYPNGNFNSDVLKVVKDCGMKTAVTIKRGRWQKGNSLFEINRVGIGGYDNIHYYKSNLSGGVDWYKKLI